MSPYHSDDSRDDDNFDDDGHDDDSHVDESHLSDIVTSDVSVEEEPDDGVRAATDITPASPASSSSSEISATSASTDSSFSESKLNEPWQLERDEYSNPAKWSTQCERLAKRFDRVGLTRVDLPADIILGFGRRGMPSISATGRGRKEKEAKGSSLPEPVSPMSERTHGAGDPRAASAGDARPMSARSLVDIPNKDTISKDCTAKTRGSMVHLLSQLGGIRRR